MHFAATTYLDCSFDDGRRNGVYDRVHDGFHRFQDGLNGLLYRGSRLDHRGHDGGCFDNRLHNWSNDLNGFNDGGFDDGGFNNGNGGLDFTTRSFNDGSFNDGNLYDGSLYDGDRSFDDGGFDNRYFDGGRFDDGYFNDGHFDDGSFAAWSFDHGCSWRFICDY